MSASTRGSMTCATPRDRARCARPETSKWCIHTAEDIKVSDAALKELRLQVENLLKPQEVKRIRTKIGLTQREAGTILGGGPNAFQKYEQDTVTVSKPMSNLLRVLERHPEEVEELRKHA